MGDDAENPDLQVKEVEGREEGSAYAAPQAEPVAATVLTSQQFYDLFKGIFAGLEWIVNKRLEPEGYQLQSIHIQAHEEASARGLADEIYKIASEPGSPISWMIAPPTKYGPVAILAFNFLMLKKEAISQDIRALRAKDVTPKKPDETADTPEDNPETPPENSVDTNQEKEAA
ncbi:hypothetical protein [Paremcibacter congregatus]|uniref:hypothetical protein n=1 Tax=Paremcibacter congregatus TaxID=2043170 RepID=UPI0030EBD801|tara:strand:- start:23713 stop:24231 length:519 start_codon:yes stop_codon:yes gene_type:complete